MITFSHLDDRKSKEVEAILRGMPKWIFYRGIIAFIIISLLIFLALVYIRYPETLKTSFRFANTEKNNVDTTRNVMVTLFSFEKVRKNQNIILTSKINTGDKISGEITRVVKLNKTCLVSIYLDSEMSITTLKLWRQQRIEDGTAELIIRYRKFSDVIFRQFVK